MSENKSGWTIDALRSLSKKPKVKVTMKVYLVYWLDQVDEVFATEQLAETYVDNKNKGLTSAFYEYSETEVLFDQPST